MKTDVDVFLTEDGVHLLFGEDTKVYRCIVTPTGGVTKERAKDGNLLIPWSLLMYHAATILEAVEIHAGVYDQEEEESAPTLEVVGGKQRD